MLDASRKLKNVSLEDFSYKAIHDLKAPLRGIDSFVKLLDKKNSANWDEKDEKYINFVFKSTAKMQNIIQDLLNFMKVTLNEHENIDLDLSALVNDVYNSLQPNDELVSFHCDKLPKVKGPKLIYELLFSNLLQNAITYVEKEASNEIKLTLKEQGNFYIYSIADKGIGIEPEDFDLIFEPLERLHSDATYLGTGLGLTICSQIVQFLKGSISVESELGKGTVFKVSIPK